MANASDEKKNVLNPANPPEDDWLLADPLGLDERLDDVFDVEGASAFDAPLDESPEALVEPVTAPTLPVTQLAPQTPRRQLILDTETTGFDHANLDRVIEIGVLEMIDRRLTGRTLHLYINPERPVGDSQRVHGISDNFLLDKPRFAEIGQQVLDFLIGGEIIAHNASFDMRFLEAELRRNGFEGLGESVVVTDTIELAKQKFAGAKLSLDALAKRFQVNHRDRTFHGALLDAQILADVYLALTGGQFSLDILDEDPIENSHAITTTRSHSSLRPHVLRASEAERQRHADWLARMDKDPDKPFLWKKSAQLPTE